jgi:hypothetical protein
MWTIHKGEHAAAIDLKAVPVVIGAEIMLTVHPTFFRRCHSRCCQCRGFRYCRPAGWPKDVRPYQARHSIALELGERGSDLADVSAVLGHRQIATTRKHYAPVLVSRLKGASERLAGRLMGTGNQTRTATAR